MSSIDKVMSCVILAHMFFFVRELAYVDVVDAHARVLSCIQSIVEKIKGSCAQLSC